MIIRRIRILQKAFTCLGIQQHTYDSPISKNLGSGLTPALPPECICHKSKGGPHTAVTEVHEIPVWVPLASHFVTGSANVLSINTCDLLHGAAWTGALSGHCPVGRVLGCSLPDTAGHGGMSCVLASLSTHAVLGSVERTFLFCRVSLPDWLLAPVCCRVGVDEDGYPSTHRPSTPSGFGQDGREIGDGGWKWLAEPSRGSWSGKTIFLQDGDRFTAASLTAAAGNALIPGNLRVTPREVLSAQVTQWLPPEVGLRLGRKPFPCHVGGWPKQSVFSFLAALYSD